MLSNDAARSNKQEILLYDYSNYALNNLYRRKLPYTSLKKYKKYYGIIFDLYSISFSTKSSNIITIIISIIGYNVF